MAKAGARPLAGTTVGRLVAQAAFSMAEEADPVEELKLRLEELKEESELKLKEAAEQSARELKDLQQTWCAFRPTDASVTRL